MHIMTLIRQLVFVLAISASLVRASEDSDRNAKELIESRGFGCELHQVTTEDGYQLTMHRIMLPNVTNQAELRPLLLQHGLFGAAEMLLVNSPTLYDDNSKYGNTLGFALALTGRYDVWLGNSRGTAASQGHESLSTDDSEYWKFGWDKMAIYDLPAMIDYIQSNTSQSKLAYVGHSQGTSIMFALLSQRPEYAQVIEPFVALAPVAYVGNTRTPLRYLARFGNPLLRTLGGQLILSKPPISSLFEGWCRLMPSLCADSNFIFTGFHPENINKSRSDIYFRYYGTSNWNVAHWAQLVLTENFARFDYGSAEKNQEHYGSDTPPEFDLRNISSSAKIALFQGPNDFLSTIEDGNILRAKLKEAGVKLIYDYIVPNPKWNHVDFIFGMDAGSVYLDRMIEVLDGKNISLPSLPVSTPSLPLPIK